MFSVPVYIKMSPTLDYFLKTVTHRIPYIPFNVNLVCHKCKHQDNCYLGVTIHRVPKKQIQKFKN
jgi:hypothetical protein